jgi:hypothetical protein
MRRHPYDVFGTLVVTCKGFVREHSNQIKHSSLSHSFDQLRSRAFVAYCYVDSTVQSFSTCANASLFGSGSSFLLDLFQDGNTIT